MQPLLPITVPVKMIKGAACQCDGDSAGVAWCERTLGFYSYFVDKYFRNPLVHTDVHMLLSTSLILVSFS